MKIKRIISLFILLLSLIVLLSSLWVTREFKFESFEVFLYTILLPTTGTPKSMIIKGIINCLIIPVLITITIFLLLNKFFKESKITILLKKKSILLVISLFVLSCVFTYKILKVDEYIEQMSSETDIYEKYCVDAKKVNYIFPEKKRNLILIYLESMETSYYNKENGGAYDKNLIPELYNLSTQHQIFTSINKQGYNVAPRAEWTIAADVASLCGIPFGSMFEENPDITSDNFLPGAYGLGDILYDNGYSNVLMCGSDGHFASTDSFFIKHGNFEIEDYNYALKQNWIPEGYSKNFGYEDEALFSFAEIELTARALAGKPFFLVMKTTDTHTPFGFICPRCGNEYSKPLFNAICCSSKLVFEFVEWIQQQEFYENTTIVLMGDHLSMAKCVKDSIDENYNRKPYFVIINPAIKLENNNHRTFCTYDAFPTILASIGVKFDSNRLGFGTNLYSEEPTLMEELKDDFFKEVRKHSQYYVNKYVLNK